MTSNVESRRADGKRPSSQALVLDMHRSGASSMAGGHGPARRGAAPLNLMPSRVLKKWPEKLLVFGLFV